MKHFALLAILLLGLAAPQVSFAGTVVRSGESVSVSADQAIEGDFYGLGSDVSISGKSSADVYVAGGTVTINAEVGADLVAAAARSVQVHAPVKDDVRIIAGEVTIADLVEGDVVVLGGVLKILSTAEVKGDVLFFGGKIDIEGAVGGGIYGRGEKVRIDSRIGGDVTVFAVQKLTLGDNADIQGNVSYTSRSDIERAEDSVIVGSVTKQALIQDDGAGPGIILFPFAMLLFAALTIFMLFKSHVQRLTRSVQSSYGMLGLIGLGMFLGVPFVASLLMASVIGFIIGMILFILYFVTLITTFVVTGMVVGTVLLKPFMKTEEVTWIGALIGTIAFLALVVIPYIGPLLMATLLIIVFGAIGKQLYESAR